MSDVSRGNHGMSGNQLYIALAVWIVLVLVGVFCTWYGWFGPGGGRGQKSSDQLPTEMAPTEAAVAPPTEEAAGQPVPTAPLEQGEQADPTQATDETFGYGIAIHGTGGPVELMDYWMGQVDSLGLGWVKQQVRWGFFEGNPGEMDWSGYDAVVDAASKQGLKVMFSVVEAPLWSRTYFDDNVEKAPPDDLTLYADFLGRLVDRYQGRIHAIEVWNEQNLDREWDTAEGVNAERYVEMLRLSYQAIKSRDPNIIVISGALSPAGGPGFDPNNPNRIIYMDDFEYFDQMVAAGFLNYCDCVGAHHNGINIPPDVNCDGSYQDPNAQFRGYWDPPQPPHHSWCFKTTLEGYHERISAAGSDKPLCVTEFGWASSEGLNDHPQGFEFALDNTQEEQAQWNVQAYQLMRDWGFVKVAFLWNLNFSQLNDGRGGADPNAPWGIINLKGAPRPAFGAITAMEKP